MSFIYKFYLQIFLVYFKYYRKEKDPTYPY